MTPHIFIAMIGILVTIASWGGAWALLKYKVATLEKKQDRLESESNKITNALIDVRSTIRDEFEKAMEKIRHLLFEDGGSARYIPRIECDQKCGRCQQEVGRRIDKLEQDSHNHQ